MGSEYTVNDCDYAMSINWNISPDCDIIIFQTPDIKNDHPVSCDMDI